MEPPQELIPVDVIEQRILLVRAKR